MGRLIGARPASERRRARRYPRRLQLEVSGLELYSTNITTAGLQLACPVLWMPHLLGDWNPRAIEVRILLPDQQWVRVLCELVYLYDYDDECLVGLRFKAFEKDAAPLWLGYVSHVANTAQRQAVVS